MIEVYTKASLVLKAKGPAILLRQYQMKQATFTNERLVEPVVLALTGDSIMGKAAMYKPINYIK